MAIRKTQPKKDNLLVTLPLTGTIPQSVMTIDDLPAELLTDIFEQVVYDDSLIDPFHPTSMSSLSVGKTTHKVRLDPYECQRGRERQADASLRNNEGALLPAVSVTILIDLEIPGHYVYLQTMVPNCLPLTYCSMLYFFLSDIVRLPVLCIVLTAMHGWGGT